MPVLYVHGVNTRSRAGFLAIEPMLRRHVAPVISGKPGSVLIDDYYWGNLGVQLAWGGASRPRTRIAGKGVSQANAGLLERSLAVGEQPDLVKRLPTASSAPKRGGALSAPGGVSGRGKGTASGLSDLTQEELAALLSGLLTAAQEQRLAASATPKVATPATPTRGGKGRAAGKPPPAAQAGTSTPQEAAAAAEYAALLMAIDTVAADPATQNLIAGKAPEQQAGLVLQLVREEAKRERARLGAAPALAGKGIAADLWNGLSERLAEALDRADDLPGYALSVVGAEFRGPLNEIVSAFLGDVFVYLHGRDDPKTRPGAILAGLVERLKEMHRSRLKSGEPLIVLTHSMGGQLVWDAVTWRLPEDPGAKDVRIDFWCAAASQVGFFEEAKLFVKSDKAHKPGRPVPFPSGNLGAWWNVWDYNDFLSFTAKDICAGVDDGPYDSGSSLLAAHGGYFTRAGFFRDLAGKIKAAKKRKFRTP